MSLPKRLNLIFYHLTMKLFLPLTLLVCSIPVQLSADVENEIPFGIEAVTGIRSEYVYRGFTLAEDSVLDFQLESEISINDDTYLNVGAWYATESGDGDFDESAFFARLSFQKTEKLTLGISATYRDFGNSVFESGVDLGVFASYQLCEDFSINGGAYYDFGAEAWYANVETNWSKTINDKSYVSLKTGVSYVNDYFGRDGINDLYARLSYTYHISETVSVTPFVGTSILIDDDSNVAGVINDDSTFGGLWFVVRF